ncbi:hypothetical protein NQ315_008028 [Exocentrus adspersus]|uniref:Tyr recombinase domain-containing protein n=1 Tax=Exocentrus adspersus TaxID=1586481 RepID=A0AAV8VWM8_9CUCU|nr:hypothetical protein NQ315_008028 [Exocentrus adspersus]
MNDNAESFSIPAEIKQEAQEATLRLLPAKSKRVYEKEMVEFDNWRKKRGLGEGTITEEYGKLTSYLKVGSRKYKTKKAKILERNQIEEFLKKAPDVEYLQVKVALILRVAGACRCNELTFLDISDVQDKGSYLYVLIPDTKTNISRSFTVMEEAFSVNAVEMCRKYIGLRPKAAESFTGHGMRRSSATLLANAGGDITTVKRHGGWKSTMVVENYIEQSLSSKMTIAEKIQVLPNVGEVVGPSSTSETPHRVNLNPGQNNKVVFELNVNVNINNNSK